MGYLYSHLPPCGVATTPICGVHSTPECGVLQQIPTVESLERVSDLYLDQSSPPSDRIGAAEPNDERRSKRRCAAWSISTKVTMSAV